MKFASWWAYGGGFKQQEPSRSNRMDCNSDFYRSCENLVEQKEGKVVCPSLE